MARKFNLKSKSLWKKIGMVALSCALFVGSIAGISALFKKAEETTKEINPTYSVGALDATTGKYVETKSAIYTKEGIECQGLTTSLEFDAVVKYQLYFYSEYDEFIHTTGTLNGVFYSTDVPVYAKYARIVIIPNEDEEITLLEKYKYSKQLNVEVNKKQEFKSFGKNLYIRDTEVPDGYKLSEDNGSSLSEASGLVTSTKILVGNKNRTLLLTDLMISSNHIVCLYLYNNDDNFMYCLTLNDGSFEKLYSVSTGSYYYIYKLSDNIGSFRVMSYDSIIPEVYLY